MKTCYQNGDKRKVVGVQRQQYDIIKESMVHKYASSQYKGKKVNNE